MMKDYAIYCTSEQTKKALELGAPIILRSEYYEPQKHDFKLDTPISCKQYTNGYCFASCPTAEEIIGWLEEQKIFVHIIPCFEVDCGWHVTSKGYSTYGYISNIERCKTRKEATIAAIDFALDYLVKEKQLTK